MTRATEMPLESLCGIVIGRTPSRANPAFWGKGQLWIAISDMGKSRIIATSKEQITSLAVDECNCRRIKSGTLLMSFKLSLGKVGFAGCDLFTNEAIVALPLRRKGVVMPEYLYHFLGSADLARAGANRAAKGLTLNKKSLSALRIPVPSMEAQAEIVSALDALETLEASHAEATMVARTLREKWAQRAFENI